MSYDPAMRLYQSVSGGTTQRLAYDGLDRIAEYDGSNAIQRRYVHGPGMDEPIVWYEGNGTTDRRFLSSDERGSIISLTDSAGTLLGINRYDEYGNPQVGNLGAFGYTGQAWLSGPGLWYYKARVYDPELGRFLQTDPIGYAASPNLYAYVLNSPVNLTDPFGMLPGGSICNGINTCSINGVDAFEVYAAEKMALAEASGWSDSAEPNRARICLETGACVTQTASTGQTIFRAVGDTELAAMIENDMKIVPSTSGLDVKYFWPKIEYAFAFGKEYITQGWVSTGQHIISVYMPSSVMYSKVTVADLSRYRMGVVYMIIVPNSQLYKMGSANVIGYVPFKR